MVSRSSADLSIVAEDNLVHLKKVLNSDALCLHVAHLALNSSRPHDSWCEDYCEVEWSHLSKVSNVINGGEML